MAMTSALQLQDKLDTYGAIRISSSPAKPPLPRDRPRPSIASSTSSAASSPFTRSPYNTTPKRNILRKGSSVEFAPHHLDDDANGEEKQRRECRRLSMREKQELYKIRPDLEIGAPLAVKSLIEEQNDRRRKVACSLLAGVGCILMLILFYYFIAWNMRDDPDFQ
ncbi:hypothetical protein H310_04962 [Aphanomyces invadans]|uniref:Uncharacterized protein n=1 Tax=Aphanomyces invadans TaxID=157072 RepID=A0A024UB86_9STRA|nr:hypothetical protein H310_04962 [Aphanomyces invadans]ETW03534.1 hypothetical protein H310_04962 [Aphanomyces invadans]|eukprot:XP_008867763.1 hypothetical protein H310_04962 [Aphanomyces invadans]